MASAFCWGASAFCWVASAFCWVASAFCWVASVMRRLRQFVEMLFTPYFATKQSLRGIFFERPLEGGHLLGRHQGVAAAVQFVDHPFQLVEQLGTSRHRADDGVGRDETFLALVVDHGEATVGELFRLGAGQAGDLQILDPGG